MENKTAFVLCGLLFIGVALYFIGFAPREAPVLTSDEAIANSINNSQLNGSISRVEIVTPSESFYKGTGKKISRTTDIVRIASPFGIGAGETLARQEPLKLEEKGLPSVETTPEGGVSASDGESSKMSSGGFRWSFLDTLWMWIKKFLWFGILGGAILLVVYFLVPGAQPIIGGIFRVIASIFPFIGSLVEKITATKTLQKPLEETVAGGQNFKDAIDKLPDLTPSQKEKIRKLFSEKMMEKQDKETQKVIDRIKLARK